MYSVNDNNLLESIKRSYFYCVDNRICIESLIIILESIKRSFLYCVNNYVHNIEQ